MSAIFEGSAGKTTFVFRTEVADRERLKEFIADASNRFVTSTDTYKIRVFETSESIRRKGVPVEVYFLTVKIEAVNFRAAALRMSKVFNYLSLLDFGINSKYEFEIAEDNRSMLLNSLNKTINVEGIFRRKLIKKPSKNN